MGQPTAARILSEMPNIEAFRDVKAVAAFAGLSPRHYQSGSTRLPSRLTKMGNAQLRTALYFPAIVAMTCDPTIKCFVQRLRKRGKIKMTVIAAAMRKLLTLAYGVLKSGQPFDPEYAAT
jgi:transposase